MRKSTKTMLTELAQETMLRPVPNRGLLFHPADVKKRESRQGKQVTFDDILKKKNDLPEDVAHWTARNFVDYFAQQFQVNTGGNYRRVYKTDCIIVAEIMRLLDENSLEKHEHTKKLIDWGFNNRMQVLERSKYMSVQALLDNVNYYVQRQSANTNKPKSDEKIDMSLIKEIEEALKTTDAFDLFEKYGIPIMVTYFAAIKDMPEEQLVQRASVRLTEIKGMPNGKKRLINIARSSISSAPYPEEFCALNWRELFEATFKSLRIETWWKNTDVVGEFSAKYVPFLR